VHRRRIGNVGRLVDLRLVKLREYRGRRDAIEAIAVIKYA